MTGHLFVVQGDLKKLWSDAWGLPTDEFGSVTEDFADSVELDAAGSVQVPKEQGWLAHRYSTGDGRLWLLNAGASRETPASWYAERAARFVALAAEALTENGRPTRGVPLVAVNVLGTGHGGHRADKGTIHEALIPALSAAAQENDCDVALVTWGPRAYSAAQRTRRKQIDPAVAFGELGRDAVEAARRLASEVVRDRLVLFIGAGASAGAGLPGWQDLLSHIAAAADLDEAQMRRLGGFDLRDQAAILAHRASTEGWFETEVAKLLRGDHYSLVDGLLASLGVREAITTNFDELFESASRAGPSERLAVLPYEPAARGERWLLKLHGSVHDGSLTLTRDDYRSLSERYGALLGIVQTMLLTRHMLFVGYSLSDDDFHEVMRQVRLARGPQSPHGSEHKLGTVVTLFEDPLFNELWSDDLKVLALWKDLEQSSMPLAEAGRRLELFLDLLCLEAADLDRYLLDSSYNAMLDPEEHALKAALEQLQTELAAIPASPGKEAVEDLLARFGSTRQATKG